MKHHKSEASQWWKTCPKSRTQWIGSDLIRARYHLARKQPLLHCAPADHLLVRFLVFPVDFYKRKYLFQKLRTTREGSVLTLEADTLEADVEYRPTWVRVGWIRFSIEIQQTVIIRIAHETGYYCYSYTYRFIFNRANVVFSYYHSFNENGICVAICMQLQSSILAWLFIGKYVPRALYIPSYKYNFLKFHAYLIAVKSIEYQNVTSFAIVVLALVLPIFAILIVFISKLCIGRRLP